MSARMIGSLPVGQRSIFLVVTLILFWASFDFDILRVVPDRASSKKLAVDDAYMIATLVVDASAPALQRDFGQIQVRIGDGQLHPYNMQEGLERQFYTLISPHDPAGVLAAVPRLRFILGLGLALAFTVFVAAILAEFGPVCAGVTALLLALSTWLVQFSVWLFWVAPLQFLPFVLAWVLGDPLRSRWQKRLLGWVFFFFCLIRFLSGYDYATNVCAAVVVPFLYYGLKRGQPLLTIVFRMLRYGALTLAAFAVSVSLQLLQWALVGGGIRNNLNAFIAEAKLRTSTGINGMSVHYDEAVLSVLHRLHMSPVHDPALERILPSFRPYLRYLRYLGMPAIRVPNPVHSFDLPIGLFVVAGIVVFWIYRRDLRLPRPAVPTNKTVALLWATLAALLVSHLWVVLANNHMEHVAFNAIVFYMPFLPMMYVLIGWGIAHAISRKRVTP